MTNKKTEAEQKLNKNIVKHFCASVGNEINNSVAQRIVHYAIELTSVKIISSMSVSHLNCGIFPHFTDNYPLSF